MKYLEYIEFSGNQCLDIDFKPTSNTRVIMDVELGAVTNNLLAFYGVRDTNSATAANQFVAWMAGAGTQVRSDYFGTSVTADVELKRNRFIIDQNRNLCTANGVTAINTAVTSGECSYNMFIGALNNLGAHAYGIIGNIYSCKVYDNDILVRDLIPAEDVYGVAGMWDRVEQRFFWNVGGEEIVAGPVKSVGMISHIFTGLENGKTYYARVFTINPKGRVNNRVDLPFVSAIPSAFPEEPTSYELIDTYTASQTFTAPEDGWYQVELFGRSGAGGKGAYYASGLVSIAAAGGGGGGGGAYCCSNKIKLNKGDTITIVISTTCTVTITASTGESYSVMTCTTGANGGAGSATSTTSMTGGSGGAGGTASGGNYANESGGAGSKGKTDNTRAALTNGEHGVSAAGGAGGSAGYTGGNAGGTGGKGEVYGNSSETLTKTAQSGGSAKAGFCKIYRGDTNIVA